MQRRMTVRRWHLETLCNTWNVTHDIWQWCTTLSFFLQTNLACFIICATLRTHQEIYCLLYAVYLVQAICVWKCWWLMDFSIKKRIIVWFSLKMSCMSVWLFVCPLLQEMEPQILDEEHFADIAKKMYNFLAFEK